MKIIQQIHLTSTQIKYIKIAFEKYGDHLFNGGFVKINRFTIFKDRIIKNKTNDYGSVVKDVSFFTVEKG